MVPDTRPVPAPTDWDRPYWSGAGNGELVLPHCVGCGLVSARRRAVCPVCHDSDVAWTAVSGRGTIHSYTIVRQTGDPRFAGHVPYVVVHVRIEEEPTCLVSANLVIAPELYPALDIELPVVATYELRGTRWMPQFALA